MRSPPRRQPASQQSHHRQRSPTTMTKVAGSLELTPTRRLASRRVPAKAAPRPITIPTPITIRLCPSTIRQNVLRLRPERHANPDFVGSLHRRVGNHAVDSDHRQDQSEHSHGSRKLRSQVEEQVAVDALPTLVSAFSRPIAATWAQSPELCRDLQFHAFRWHRCSNVNRPQRHIVCSSRHIKIRAWGPRRPPYISRPAPRRLLRCTVRPLRGS